jgi:hypothetical protein
MIFASWLVGTHGSHRGQILCRSSTRQFDALLRSSVMCPATSCTRPAFAFDKACPETNDHSSVGLEAVQRANIVGLLGVFGLLCHGPGSSCPLCC